MLEKRAKLSLAIYLNQSFVKYLLLLLFIGRQMWELGPNIIPFKLQWKADPRVAARPDEDGIVEFLNLWVQLQRL